VLLTRAVANPEIASTLPHTVAALSGWDRKSARRTPPLPRWSTIWPRPADNTTGSWHAHHAELPGARSIIMKTARAVPLQDADGKPLPRRPSSRR